MANDPKVIELVSWLEQTAHAAEPTGILRSWLGGVRRTARSVGYDFSRLASEGVLEVNFRLPVERVTAAAGLGEADVEKVVELLATIPGKEIAVEIIDDPALGPVFFLRRFHYIPHDRRDAVLEAADALGDLVDQLVVEQEGEP